MISNRASLCKHFTWMRYSCRCCGIRQLKKLIKILQSKACMIFSILLQGREKLYLNLKSKAEKQRISGRIRIHLKDAGFAIERINVLEVPFSNDTSNNLTVLFSPIRLLFQPFWFATIRCAKCTKETFVHTKPEKISCGFVCILGFVTIVATSWFIVISLGMEAKLKRLFCFRADQRLLRELTMKRCWADCELSGADLRIHLVCARIYWKVVFSGQRWFIFRSPHLFDGDASFSFCFSTDGVSHTNAMEITSLAGGCKKVKNEKCLTKTA